MRLFSNQIINFKYSISSLLWFFFKQNLIAIFIVYYYHMIRKTDVFFDCHLSVTNNLDILTHLYFCVHNILYCQIIYRDLMYLGLKKG